MSNGSIMPIERALVSFSQVRLAEAGPLERTLDDCKQRGILVPIEDVDRGLHGQFEATRGSVIDPGDQPERYLWRGATTITLEAASKVSISNGRILVSVWRRHLGSRVLVVSLAATLERLEAPDVIIALTKSFEGHRASQNAQTITVDGIDEPLHKVDDVLTACSRRLVGELDKDLRRHETTLRKDAAEHACAQRTKDGRRARGEGRTPAEHAPSTAATKTPKFELRDPSTFRFRIVELRGIPPLMSPPALHSAIGETRRALYGVLSGDEGWQYAPESRARRAVERGWGSRSFFWVVGLGDGVLLLNDKPPAYATDADNFFRTWLGDTDPYFTTKYDLAGLDHGVLYAMERIACIGVRADHLIADIRKTTEHHRQHGRLPHFRSAPISWFTFRSRRLRSTRLRLLACRESAGQTRIAELGKLYHVLEADVGLAARIETLERYSDVVDQEINAVIAARLGRLAIMIAVLSVGLTVAFKVWT